MQAIQADLRAPVLPLSLYKDSAQLAPDLQTQIRTGIEASLLQGLPILPGQGSQQQLPDMTSPAPPGPSAPARVNPDSNEGLTQHIVAGAGWASSWCWNECTPYLVRVSTRCTGKSCDCTASETCCAGASRLRSAVEHKYRTVEQVSFVDLALHPRLAQRARAELGGRFSSPEREAMLHAQVWPKTTAWLSTVLCMPVGSTGCCCCCCEEDQSFAGWGACYDRRHHCTVAGAIACQCICAGKPALPCWRLQLCSAYCCW